MSERATGKYASALRNRDLRTLILAFITDGAATWSYNIVLVAYVFDRTHSAGWITALVTVRWIAGMAIGGYAGVLADRFDRRVVLSTSAAAATVVTLAIALIVQTNAPLGLLLVASAALTAVATPIRPASGALIPEVVDESELITANSIFALLESLIVVVGPGVGGLLLLTGKPVYGILLNAASYVVAGALYASLHVRSRGSAEPGANLVKQLTAGVVALGQHRKALVLTAFLLLDSAAINAANVVMPALARHLHGGASAYSLLLTANAFGGVVIATVANKFAGSARITAIIALSIALECVPLWVSVYAHSVPNALVLQLISGMGMVIVDVLAFTALQRDLPRDVLGRVLGSVDVLLLGTSIVTTLAVSQLYAHVGLGWALALIGLGFPVLALFGLPSLLALDRESARTVARLRGRTSVLEGLDLFAGAPYSLIERLADSAVEESVSAGEVLIRQGDLADDLWLLTEGELAVSAVRDDGTPIELPTVTAPGYVGELGLLHRAPRSATVVVASACRLLRISGEEFLAALEDAAPSPTMLARAGVRLSRTSAPAARRI